MLGSRRAHETLSSATPRCSQESQSDVRSLRYCDATQNLRQLFLTYGELLA